MKKLESLKASAERQAAKLAQTKARLILEEAKEKRKQQQQARAADAHRKILLGGVVIASGADSLDEAELCGWLLTALEKRTENLASAMRERGLQRFAERAEAKSNKKGRE